ncbi:uncharacterized protein DNG_00387 [Cephalotrichum gorgonifer]|uniref:CorA domain-containing protein n=1 Tax=Cephalotrichum gorgonifer TaxID=2041049 RepID=A0AAE8MP57_9PEZI|nr:uncharacterized protein DNG_00387 [Cephalotrichum gorgonifer]
MADYIGLRGSDLFSFDNRAALDSNILYDDDTDSKTDYDEYVVYKKPEAAVLGCDGYEDSHVSHKVSFDDKEGAGALDKAFRRGQLLDYGGNFTVPHEDDISHDHNRLQGRVRRVICFRRAKSSDGSQDGLSLSLADFEILRLHPATLQYSRRTTTESRFWSKDGSQLSIVLSFASNAKTPYDFLSMTYNVHTRNSSVLIRQSYHPRRHRQESLDEYDHRMEACRIHWAHPFVTPVVLLQVHFLRTEEAVGLNKHHVTALEHRVSSVAGFEATAANEYRIRDKQEARAEGETTDDDDDDNNFAGVGAMTMTNLMKRAHEVLKESIELMDAIRWTERAVKVLILAGDELAERRPTDDVAGRQSPPPQEDPDMHPPLPRTPNLQSDEHQFKLNAPRLTLSLVTPRAQDADDPLSDHWHDIRQYLEGLLRICMSLETERRMSEARCRAQIDIIYSKMAQEDNVLNARMAVASSRDSSSMKALAVITAIFLPGEFLGTLFGMSMFDWMAEDDDPAGSSKKTGAAAEDDDPILSQKFWIYWLVCIPLTVFILCAWRGWWVTEDRFFRRHLSKELSEERYWTTDGKPRKLQQSYLYDFFRLSARWDEKSGYTGRRGKKGKKGKKGGKERPSEKHVQEENPLPPGLSGSVDFEPKDADSIRHLRSLFARRESILRRRPSEVV